MSKFSTVIEQQLLSVGSTRPQPLGALRRLPHLAYRSYATVSQFCLQEQSVYKAEAKVSSVSDGKLLCTLQAVAPCAVACNNMCIVIGQFSFQLSFSFLLVSDELVINVFITKLIRSRTPFPRCWLLSLNFSPV